MYNPYQQNPYNPYLGQMNPYPWPLQPSVSPPPQYQPIQNQKPQMPQTELSPQNRPVTLGGRIINDPAEIMPSETWAGQAAYGSCGTAYGYGCGTCC